MYDPCYLCTTNLDESQRRPGALVSQQHQRCQMYLSPDLQAYPAAVSTVPVTPTCQKVNKHDYCDSMQKTYINLAYLLLITIY